MSKNAISLSALSPIKEIFKKSLLALSVTSIASVAAPAAMAEEATDEVERIEVTGSRIKRVNLEGATPITVIDAADLINSGFATVGDALRDSNLNAFGSWGGGANNGWASQSTVQLKGASAQHTLTLLDGKRMAKSPVLDGGASNLNTIPMAAVQRIEILTDGASAIYGTDAIAGVINIILKKDFEGLRFDARTDKPSADGGDSGNFSFTGGLSSDKGSLVFTFEHYDSERIMQSERSYTEPYLLEGGDPTDANDWANLSWTGRVLKQGGAGGWAWEAPFSGGQDCASVYGDAFLGPVNDRNYAGDNLCLYDYTRAAATSSDHKRDNTLVQYTYNLTDDISLVARAYWAKTETKDISAPVPGNIAIPQGLPAYTTDAGLELRELYADPYASMGFRFDTAGDRVAEHHDTVFDYLLGLEGSEENFDWDISITYNNYTNFTWGTGYLLDGAQNSLVGEWDTDLGEFVGWDPRDPNSPLPAGSTANYDKRMTADYLDVSGGISFEFFELSGGAIGSYVGASYREESLDSKVDALAEAGLIIGGNGGSGGLGKREVSSVYFEMLLPVFDNLEVNLAGRYDDYSDFGGTFNPQMSIRYNPTSDILIRASVGQGFRAPTLSDLYQGTTEGYGTLTNYIGCYEAGNDIDSCNLREEAPTQTGGNLDLGAEESDTFNIGLVWNISDNFDLTADYWSLETEGLIESISSNELLQTQAKLYQAADQAGVARPDVSLVYSGAAISLLPNGRIDHVTAPKVNLGRSEREGIDFTFNANFDTEYGNFDAGINVSKYLTYKYTYVDNGVSVISEDEAGRTDTPDLRINMNIDYTLGNHSIHYFANYIDEQTTYDFKGDDESSGLYVIDDYLTHNLSYNYQLPWSNSITVGVTNLTDEDPKFDKFGAYAGNLYSIRGRTYYLAFKQDF
jgi:iron complex outermembrane receptor protein